MGVGIQKRELVNRLACFIAHLLKWQYQPAFRSSSWEATIKEQRRQCCKLIAQNPSLKNNLSELLTDAYEDALYEAVKETGLNVEKFPSQLLYSFEEIMSEDFLSRVAE